jgi:hypothetical protein
LIKSAPRRKRDFDDERFVGENERRMADDLAPML